MVQNAVKKAFTGTFFNLAAGTLGVILSGALVYSRSQPGAKCQTSDTIIADLDGSMKPTNGKESDKYEMVHLMLRR